MTPSAAARLLGVDERCVVRSHGLVDHAIRESELLGGRWAVPLVQLIEPTQQCLAMRLDLVE